ncbi:MAG: L-lactate permease [Gracilibacteraceae bacterium]|jgi:lactate permease|nr:L-lactate permease [Gracilibacteraceae bacterium]
MADSDFIFIQNYDPLNNVLLSTFLSALPVLVLLYLLAIHPHKDKNTGKTILGIYAPYAAIAAAITAFLVALFMCRMPASSAVMAFVYGVLYGIFSIGWIVFGAIFLYNTTVITGKFEILRDSIAGLTPDRRLQSLLIAFSFGAFIEGACGFGTPVAVAGAIMCGLGFRPLTAAVICLIANTAPVAWGAVGTPIITLAGTSEIPAELLSKMAGHQLPFFSVIIPIWLVATLVFMDKGKFADVIEVLPGCIVCGLSFAITQFTMAEMGNVMLVDIGAGIVSLVVTTLFFRVWQPKHIMGHEDFDAANIPKHSMGEIVMSWMPWVFLAVAVGIWGWQPAKTFLGGLFSPAIEFPYLHNLTSYDTPLVTEHAPLAARWVFNFFSLAGTGILVAAILSGLIILRLSPAQWGEALKMTLNRMKVPITVICTVLGLGYLTRYAGTDVILGIAFTRTGVMYPFFAAMLGWLGVFLTGSDSACNAMFGHLQRVTAELLHLNPVLIVATNSTGGVMGKMIDPQSIIVASITCYKDKDEGMAAIGPIFRAVVGHSVVLAALMGILVMLEAYVFTGLQVHLPEAAAFVTSLLPM